MASGIITLHTDIPLDGNCLASYSLLCFCISMVTDPPIKHQWLLASLDQSNTGYRSVAANPLILRSQALDPGIPAQDQWDPTNAATNIFKKQQLGNKPFVQYINIQQIFLQGKMQKKNLHIFPGFNHPSL